MPRKNKAVKKAPLKIDGGGLRYNDGKLRFDLIPPDVMQEIARVMTHGAKKYAERNWERGMAWSICRGSAERHWNQRLLGFTHDDGPKGSGLRHLAHNIVNTMFLLAYELRGMKKHDDLEPFLRATSKTRR